MRIVIVNNLYFPDGTGGAERSVRELAEGLTSAGHDVLCVALSARGAPAGAAEVAGVHVRRIESRAFEPFRPGSQLSGPQKLAWHAMESARVHNGRALRAIIGDFRPDVVHTNNIAGFGVGSWIAAGSTPLVHTLRDFYLLCPRTNMYRSSAICELPCARCSAFRLLHRRSPRRPDLFTGVSQDIIDRHRRAGFLTDDDAARAVLNAPILQAVARTPATDGGVTFGYLGRVAADKGIWLLLDAFRALASDRARLEVAGVLSPGDAARMDAVLASDQRISYVGRVAAPDFLARVDWLAVPTQWAEPFGRVAAEARLAGCGLIASRIGGLPEVVARYGGRLVNDYRRKAAWTEALAQVTASVALGEAVPSVPATGPVDEYLAAYVEATRRYRLRSGARRD